jgi:hypothetical protein
MRNANLLILTIICHLSVRSQQIKYSGKITAKNGQPVPFATVSVQNTKTIVSADAESVFSIDAVKSDTLLFNAVNFLPLKTVIGLATELLMTLTRVDTTLPEVLVTTAFNVQREQRVVPYSSQLFRVCCLSQSEFNS